MSCPVCGDRCTCSGANAASSLIDPDEYDLSEERFAASLEEQAEVAEQIVERPGEPAWKLVGAGTAAASMPLLRGDETRSRAAGGLGMDEGAIWRQEVASRVESYRARRRRPIRERSLPLDFERAVNREMTLGHLSESGEETQLSSSEARFEEEIIPAPGPEWADTSVAESNLIEFPRQALLPVMPPSSEELAEPVIDRPRILEVSEEVDTTAPLGDIDVAPQEDQHAAIEFELPLQVAPMAQRVFAGLLDDLIVMVGSAVFVMITLKAGVPLPQAKAGFLLALAAPCLFWAIYVYMFLVYGGTTPGMQMAKLKLITFDGGPAGRRTRRGRALAMVLSTLSLGLGLVWALLDEDTLCWHDRITRTYIVGRA